ncbi:MAG: M48 family metallopeptidase, partial [Pirellula sp.]
MDFFDHQERARRNTVLLTIYFVIAIILIIACVYFAVLGILAFSTAGTEQPIPFDGWHPELLGSVVVVVGIIIATGSLFKIWALGGHGETVAIALGGVKVPANTTALEERILLNVVEEMALASGTPVPPVYILENESGINAFAAGTSPQNAVIGITRGAITTLRRDELQGVIAHEFSHILNGDMKLNLRLMGLLNGILLIALIGYFFIRSLNMVSMRGSSRNDDNKGAAGMVAALLLLGSALIAIGYIGVFFANMIKSAVSRQREFLADASAVQFTRNPNGISDALKRIGGWKQHARLTSARASESSHMFFGEGVASFFFATHPPLPVRIKRIEPNFQGIFPTTGPVTHSVSELIDPNSLALARASFAGGTTTGGTTTGGTTGGGTTGGG